MDMTFDACGIDTKHLIFRSGSSSSRRLKKPAGQFNSTSANIVFQELPNHIALAYTIYGCPLACEGCHSTDTWNASQGQCLTDETFKRDLEKYQGLINAVVFFGGEWQPHALQSKLILAQHHGLTTCLYTGLDSVSRLLKPHLNFVKTGRWVESLGGIQSTTSNQRFFELKHGQFSRELTHLFREDPTNTLSLNSTIQGAHHATA